jgi:hypothetical protein
MKAKDLIILNFEEARRRSMKLWLGVPPEFHFWKPDQYAMNSIEMVRHVLDCEYYYHNLIEKRGIVGDDFISP